MIGMFVIEKNQADELVGNLARIAAYSPQELENLEEELAPDTFFRVSRKYYVNIEAIQDIISYTNSRLQIKLKACEDQEIIVSRERVKDFKLWLS